LPAPFSNGNGNGNGRPRSDADLVFERDFTVLLFAAVKLRVSRRCCRADAARTRYLKMRRASK
jgi:hypothetical protein